MGLSGKKVKQRIPNDPRNLSWADDAARFGSNYLSKFGWDASKGLGTAGEGRTTHIKVAQKLDMMGIGAAHQRDPNGIAWKQNRDFENVLRRLNNAELGDAVDTDVKIGGFHRARDDFPAEEPTKGVKEKKRKHKDEGEDASEDQEGGKQKKRKSKKQKADDKAMQSNSGSDPLPSKEKEIAVVEVSGVSAMEVKTTKPTFLPRHRSHRARAIAAKNMSSKSASHISEILGIAPTPSASGSATPQEGKLTSLVDEDVLRLEKITTSTKSVADYFKEKLKNRANSSASTPSTLVMNSDEEAVRRGIGSAPSTSADPYEDDEKPRFGLGASRLRFETPKDIDNAQRIGLSQLSKLTSSAFLTGTTTMTVPSPQMTLMAEESGTDEQEPEPTERRRKDKKRSVAVGEANEESIKRKRKSNRKDKTTPKDIEDEPQPDTMGVGADSERSTREEERRKKDKKKKKKKKRKGQES
ncbi:hypothetical protein CPB83DRAFT_798570 [Crepidotus variabilis]|uniref:PinX1-related protein 1 n=1 Tax=Crepidotus variabilis TaxID=179855 RepID=A0A9P6JKA1_9AGAR|nr:hypothetical protein CPB83DRAFT_798570 [Crepidotus variabilis]